MKKLLSVALVLIMMLSVFTVTASAEAIVVGYYDTEIDDLYYWLYEDDGVTEAYVVGYEADTFNPAPAGAITVPDTITYQGDEYTVTGIESMAFYQCLFTSITLPDTIKYIGEAAFSTSDYLENVIVPDECYFDYFGGSVFSATPFEAEIYSKDETIFGKNVLYSYIGNADEYVIPEEINILANNCFFMSGVKSVVINSNITEIPFCAFASCRNLTSIDIPDSVDSIYDGAFKDCSSLETVTLGEGVAYIGLDSFANTKIKSIHLGQAVYSITGAFRNCNALETITIDPANTALKTDGNAVYLKTNYVLDISMELGYMLEYYIPSKAQGTVQLLSDVYMINSYAFYGCKDLKEVKAGTLVAIDVAAFANSGIEKLSATALMFVYDSAFKNCKNLTDITLDSVVYFGSGAFENCTSLTDVTFSSSVYEIGGKAFANTGLTDIVIYGEDCYVGEGAFMNCQSLETVRLEEGVSYVGMNAFLNCSKLGSIYLSKTVNEFEENAFNGCDNVTFQLIKNTKAYKYIKNNTDFNFEIVGRYTLWQRILDFFRLLFNR